MVDAPAAPDPIGPAGPDASAASRAAGDGVLDPPVSCAGLDQDGAVDGPPTGGGLDLAVDGLDGGLDPGARGGLDRPGTGDAPGLAVDGLDRPGTGDAPGLAVGLERPALDSRLDPGAREPLDQAELVDAALGGRLREVIDAGLVDAPGSFCFSAFSAFERCPLSYALKYICGLEAAEPVPAFSFGTAAHRAFELFTRARRERRAAGEPPPTRADLDAFFAEAWTEVDFPDEPARTAWFARSGPMLDAFLAAEGGRALATGAETIAEEAYFALPLRLADGSEVTLSGVIDRLDRGADGSLELLDYKTGPAWGPVARTYGLQLAIYALGCRDALGLEAPRRALLYFVEHALFAVRPVSGEAIETTRREAGERAVAIRESDFAPTPSPSACRLCDFRAICPVSSGTKGIDTVT